MRTLKRIATHWRLKLALTPEQADQLAAIKFPGC
jgi:hypothetical protein